MTGPRTRASRWPPACHVTWPRPAPGAALVTASVCWAPVSAPPDMMVRTAHSVSVTHHTLNTCHNSLSLQARVPCCAAAMVSTRRGRVGVTRAGRGPSAPSGTTSARSPTVTTTATAWRASASAAAATLESSASSVSDLFFLLVGILYRVCPWTRSFLIGISEPRYYVNPRQRRALAWINILVLVQI